MGIKVKCYTDPQKPLQEQLGLPHFFIHLTSFLEGGKGQVTVWLQFMLQFMLWWVAAILLSKQDVTSLVTLLP